MKRTSETIHDIDMTGYHQDTSAEVKVIDKANLIAKFKTKVEKQQNIIIMLQHKTLNNL